MTTAGVNCDAFRTFRGSTFQVKELPYVIYWGSNKEEARLTNAQPSCLRTVPWQLT
jgi:hypothetical protein